MSSQFHTTRWSIVARGAHGDATIARQAIGELCAAYWFPLYAFLRRGGGPHDACMDLVQSFCANLMERGAVGSADRSVGRFRHYLLGALRHFVSNEGRRTRAKKQWADAHPWSWDDAVERFATGVHESDTPERQYERRWALGLLARAQDRLRAEYATPTRRSVLAALEPHLHESAPGVLIEVASALGLTENATRVTLHRIRRRLRDLVREEVAQTVVDPADIDDEIRALQAALAP